RDRLEELLNLPFNDPQLSVGVHFPPGAGRTDDLPPVLPSPKTGILPAPGGGLNPFTLSYQVKQYQAANIDASKGAVVATGAAFTPLRAGCASCPVAAGNHYEFKRIEVTVVSGTGPLGIGARVARIAGII